MSVSPTAVFLPRAIAFVDGMNLFNSAKSLYGHARPQYDVRALAQSICAREMYDLVGTRFYSGLPDEAIDPRRHYWWLAKLRAMRRDPNVKTWTRPVRYDNSNGVLLLTTSGTPIGREKGVDLRMGLDIVELAALGSYDVALVFSVDQDFSEVVQSVKNVNQRLVVSCVYPVGKYAIKGMAPISFDRAEYDACLDSVNYDRQVTYRERDLAGADRYLTDLAVKWGRVRTVVMPTAGTVTGILRAIIPCIGGSEAIVCVDDGARLCEATIVPWSFWKRDLGYTTTLDIDANGTWKHHSMITPVVP